MTAEPPGETMAESSVNASDVPVRSIGATVGAAAISGTRPASLAISPELAAETTPTAPPRPSTVNTCNTWR